MAYIPRVAESRVREALQFMPAVFLNGPRQAGKSTLAQHLARTVLKADYVTLDDLTMFSAASNDPEGFLRGLRTPLIVDEVQRVPALFRVLKTIIDEERASGRKNANGRFLLTGSANVMALPGLSEALVGRMAIQSLYPLSAAETFGSSAPVIGGLFDRDFPSPPPKPGGRPSFADLVQRATYPGIAGEPASAGALWFDGYIATLLQRDMQQLADIENIPALQNIVKLLAARASGLLNDADAARDAKLNAMTYRRYRVLVQQLFLIHLVPAWSRNVSKRLVKAPKLYFIDTALLCHQFGVDAATLDRANPGQFGRVFENFVASELIKQLGMTSGVALHHFRSRDGHEVDFVLERRDGTLVGLEVKAAASVTADDFSGLRVLKQQAGKDFHRGVVLYRGARVVPFGDDMLALPLEGLWNSGDPA